ncbi:hypothetical protein [Selenomonas artemidis]|jgi:hypothetical protein|nr:hypothetical protein [Selenomonas artemidis]
MTIEQFIFFSLMLLASTIINVTVAGWLVLKMAELLWEKIQRL